VPDRDRLRTIFLIACTAAFVAVGISITEHAFANLDLTVARWFEQRITAARTVFAFLITQFGSDIFILAATAYVALDVRKRSRYWLERILITVVGAMVLNEILKFVFYRKRPDFGHPLLQLSSNSFPSGHTVSVTVFFGMVILLTRFFNKSKFVRAAVTSASLVMIFLVAASRIYLGVHYFSDVVGAFFEALAWMTAVGIMLERKYRTSISETRRYGTTGSS
jgi:undecaprenyl-diphosphatase